MKHFTLKNMALVCTLMAQAQFSIAANGQSAGQRIHAPLPTVSGDISNHVLRFDVTANQMENDDNIWVFMEKQNYSLRSTVNVDTVNEGSTFGKGGIIEPKGGEISEKTKVNVYYIHYDRVGSDNDAIPLAGSVTFPGTILGLIFLDENLQDTHQALGSKFVIYGGDGDQNDYDRQIELNTNYPDQIVWQDRHTLDLTLFTSTSADQIRVITTNYY